MEELKKYNCDEINSLLNLMAKEISISNYERAKSYAEMINNSLKIAIHFHYIDKYKSEIDLVKKINLLI